MVDADLSAVEEAVDRFTFPISKRDMMDGIADDETLLMDGRNVELRTLVRDLNDDFFESEDEFREALRTHFGGGWSGTSAAPARMTDR